MLGLSFTIKNPFRFKDIDQVDYICKDIGLSRNKSLEIQLSKWSMRDLFHFRFDLSWKGMDHSGPSINVELLGYMFELMIYDHRHWNYEEQRWELYPGESDEIDMPS